MIVSLPTIASLCSTLGKNLVPSVGFKASANIVSAVHISELLDPTPYLNGGELLLTTGLTLPASRIGCEKYIARLTEIGVSALGLGLGPVHASTPEQLTKACGLFGLTLLEVPPSTPFTTITKAYWTAVSRLTEQHLNDALATHRALVNAAVSRDPIASMLRTLARAFNGWAAIINPRGTIEQVFPLGMLEDAEAATGEISRLRVAGVHSAASFPVADHVVVLYPLPIEDRIVGYLAAGTPTGLNTTERGIVTTACALLSLDAVHRERGDAGRQASLRPVALLIDMGLIDAARRLAAHLNSPAIHNTVKILTVRTKRLEAVIRATGEWCNSVVGVQVDGRHGWLLMPNEHPPLATLESDLKEIDPAASAIISPSIELENVGRARTQMLNRLDGLRQGELLFQELPTVDISQDLNERVADIVNYRRADLTTTLVAYLRHRGQWELAARELNVHRNTVRHRVGRCERILGYSLGDPDVSATLWLLLRNKGLA